MCWAVAGFCPSTVWKIVSKILFSSSVQDSHIQSLCPTLSKASGVRIEREVGLGKTQSEAESRNHRATQAQPQPQRCSHRATEAERQSQSHRATEPQSHRATEPQSHSIATQLQIHRATVTEPHSHSATAPQSHRATEPKPQSHGATATKPQIHRATQPQRHSHALRGGHFICKLPVAIDCHTYATRLPHVCHTIATGNLHMKWHAQDPGLQPMIHSQHPCPPGV